LRASRQTLHPPRKASLCRTGNAPCQVKRDAIGPKRGKWQGLQLLILLRLAWVQRLRVDARQGLPQLLREQRACSPWLTVAVAVCRLVICRRKLDSVCDRYHLLQPCSCTPFQHDAHAHDVHLGPHAFSLCSAPRWQARLAEEEKRKQEEQARAEREAAKAAESERVAKFHREVAMRVGGKQKELKEEQRRDAEAAELRAAQQVWVCTRVPCDPSLSLCSAQEFAFLLAPLSHAFCRIVVLLPLFCAHPSPDSTSCNLSARQALHLSSSYLLTCRSFVARVDHLS